VAGERGHRYAVRLYNDSPRRVLVVLSVDGVNAISGEDADPSQTGYVLNPGQRADITGWRKSQDEVAQFVFSSPSGSYASRTGRPDNIGVVGVAVFEEARRWRPEPILRRGLPLPRPRRPKPPPMPVPAASRATPASRRPRRWVPATAHASSPRCAIPTSSAPAAARTGIAAALRQRPQPACARHPGGFALAPAARTAGLPQPLRAGPAGALITAADSTTPATSRCGRRAVGEPKRYL
jgi:hypothetical protein